MNCLPPKNNVFWARFEASQRLPVDLRPDEALEARMLPWELGREALRGRWRQTLRLRRTGVFSVPLLRAELAVESAEGAGASWDDAEANLPG